ncbi:MAG: hypothetical protein IPP29_03685 [Bacteroidetes bacterium]|nr:hypothetical protein [Bacteroidota bacterium]
MNSTFKIFIVAFAALSTLIYAGFKAENNALTEISACMQSQQASWNSGNLEAYMSCYWKSDSLQFVGKRVLNMDGSKPFPIIKSRTPMLKQWENCNLQI